MVNWEMELGESHNETVWNQWTKSLSVEMPLHLCIFKNLCIFNIFNILKLYVFLIFYTFSTEGHKFISMYILLCVLPSLNKGFTYLLTLLTKGNFSCYEKLLTDFSVSLLLNTVSRDASLNIIGLNTSLPQRCFRSSIFWLLRSFVKWAQLVQIPENRSISIMTIPKQFTPVLLQTPVTFPIYMYLYCLPSSESLLQFYLVNHVRPNRDQILSVTYPCSILTSSNIQIMRIKEMWSPKI